MLDLAFVLAIALIVLFASLVQRFLLTKTDDPIYIVPRSRVPTLGGGDLYLALKRAGVGVSTSPETVRLEQRRREAITTTAAPNEREKP